MARLLLWTALTLALAGTASAGRAPGLGLGPTAPPDSVPAAPADAFVETVGVNTHFIYDDTKYYTEFDAVRDRLVELGVRYVRDAPWMPGNWKRPRVLDLYDQTGIRLVALVGERRGAYPSPLDLDPGATRAVVRGVAEHYNDGDRRAVVAFEGPNEYDLSHGPDPDWAGSLRAYQSLLYAAVRQDPVVGGLPVLAPSLVWTASYAAVGSLADVADASNAHPYPGGRRPTHDLDRRLAQARAVTRGALWITETGYHNALGDAADGTGDITHPGVPEAVEARYLPRLYAEYFRRGIARTFAYELLDVYPDADNDSETANFGLLRNDLTPKPAFHALRRLIGLLADPGPAFEPGALRYTLAGADGVESLLLQKRDGRFYLLLWRDVSSYQVPSGWRTGETGRVLNPAPVRVALDLADRARRVAVYSPTQADAPTATYGPVGQVEVDVADQLVVVEVTPNAAPEGQPDAAETTGDVGVRIDVLGNDRDPDGDPVEVVLVTPPVRGTIAADGPGAFVYVPEPAFVGTDEFRYVVTDGAASSAPVAVRVTVSARPVTALTLDGREGWRFLGPPASEVTVGELLGPLWTQGFAGADGPGGKGNVFFYDPEDGAYAAPASADDPASPGRGLAVFVFADDEPGVPGQFPKTLPVAGPAVGAPFAFPVAGAPDGDRVADGWHVLSNPLATDLEWGGEAWSGARVGKAVYVWDAAHPGGPQYRVWNGVAGSLEAGRIPSGAGFWVQTAGSDATLVGGTATETEPGRVRPMVLDLTLAVGPEDAPRTASTSVVFRDGADAGLGDHDAFGLVPPTAGGPRLFSVLDDGTALAVDARPWLGGAPVEVPVRADAAGAAGPVSAVLSWTAGGSVPDDWSLTLVDHATGSRMDLREPRGYAFEMAGDAGGAADVRTSGRAPAPTAHRAAPAGRTARTAPPRFSVVAGRLATDTEPGGEGGLLRSSPPFPNPFERSAHLPFVLDAPAEVSLDVFDVLGRRVARHARSAPAGAGQAFDIEAAGLASGAYVYRLVAASGGRTGVARGRITLR